MIKQSFDMKLLKCMKCYPIKRGEKMKQFSNLETTLIAKWFGHEIDLIVEENKDMDATELQSLVSEIIENKLKEQLGVFSEGYISELVGDSFEKIAYAELVNYYSQDCSKGE